jgi:hypothetical protein
MIRTAIPEAMPAIRAVEDVLVPSPWSPMSVWLNPVKGDVSPE